MLAVCVLALVGAPRAVVAQLEVDQLELFVRSVGGEREATFRVRNASAEEQTARLVVSDWDRADDGLNRFTDRGTVDGSCSDAVTVFPAVASLRAGESQEVRVSYTGGPRDVMCWAAVLVELAPRPQARRAGAGVSVEVRSAVKLYVAPVAERLDVRIEAVDIGRHVPRHTEPASDTLSSDAIAMLRNVGNTQVRAKLRVEYRNTADSVVARHLDNDVPLLPGATRQWRARVPMLAPGRYIVLIVVDYGGPELVAGQIDLELVP